MRNVWTLVVTVVVSTVGVSAAEEFVGEIVSVEDRSLEVEFQDHDHVGAHGRGRALVVSDFDRDGRPDVFIGNPGDASLVLRNRSTEDGFVFEPAQQLFTDEDDILAWGAQPADFDNDGDIDLFISGGGNECTAFDHLFRNLLVETGELKFFDVTRWAGVRGRPGPGGSATPMASGNAVWFDVDEDGWLDLFVNGNNRFACGQPNAGDGKNILWRNNGPQAHLPHSQVSFTDITAAVGLDIYDRPSRHSFFFDYDSDGDFDLYEMNFRDENALWQNRLREDGELFFVDVSAEMAALGDDLRFPFGSFASCPTDIDNDGWEDLVVFQRGHDDTPTLECAFDPGLPFTPPQSLPEDGSWPFGDGHAVFVNRGIDVNTGEHLGFDNRAQALGLNNPYIARHGVMGTQLGDVNGDGTVDIYIGNGGQPTGQRDQFLVSETPGPLDMPRYIDHSELINTPVAPPYDDPPAPYRTHGTAIVDIDGDGQTEVLVVNGGPAEQEDSVREPNRLWEFNLDAPYNFMRIRLEGDGVEINRDGIGSRVLVTASNDSETWTVQRTLYSGTCFSASNGFDVFFGLRNAHTIDRVHVVWPDGQTTSQLNPPLNSTLVVRRVP